VIENLVEKVVIVIVDEIHVIEEMMVIADHVVLDPQVDQEDIEVVVVAMIVGDDLVAAEVMIGSDHVTRNLRKPIKSSR
jgi:hypothetical protein